MSKANDTREDSLSSAEKMTTAHVEHENVHPKDLDRGHANYHGINTSDVLPGADAAYEKKIAVMNEALIDIGMGPFQWKIFFMTGFGWFVDNVSGIFLEDNEEFCTDCYVSSGCKQSPSSVRLYRGNSQSIKFL